MMLPARYSRVFLPFFDSVYSDEFVKGNKEYGLVPVKPERIVPAGFAFVCPGCTAFMNAGFAERHSNLRVVKVHYCNVFTRNGNPGAIWQAWNPDGTEIIHANRHEADLDNMRFSPSIWPGRKCHFHIEASDTSEAGARSTIRYLDDCDHDMRAEPGGTNPVPLKAWNEYPELEQWLADATSWWRRTDAEALRNW